jgi:hypothetical protein
MNMKRMWCEYSCNPNKTQFGKHNIYLDLFLVQGVRYQNDTDPLIGNETVTLFTLDPNYACTLFKSCEKVSLIA